MVFFLLLRPTAWIPLFLPFALAQHHQPPLQDRDRSNGRYTAGLIVGVSIGVIVLLFLASVLYAKFVNRRRAASRGQVERGRTDEEFRVTPIPAPLVTAPPPYENPPSFEDATKRTQTASAVSSQQREEQEGRNDVAG
ncbi:hypothetical protein BJ322DRAFT_359040 [Thelephora terrestris]|uniref:Uncharacterized protein n=1 Tax=Thelephora terrestris TaxID=56493 RepID=A0A9P6L266_9AGAM|nr:hypothetical protein BJ322DRAFT_359040 [Thelephora terrestris]